MHLQRQTYHQRNEQGQAKRGHHEGREDHLEQRDKAARTEPSKYDRDRSPTGRDSSGRRDCERRDGDREAIPSRNNTGKEEDRRRPTSRDNEGKPEDRRTPASGADGRATDSPRQAADSTPPTSGKRLPEEEAGARSAPHLGGGSSSGLSGDASSFETRLKALEAVLPGPAAASGGAAVRESSDVREPSQSASRRGSGNTGGTAPPVRRGDLTGSGSRSRSGSEASKESWRRRREEDQEASDRSNRAQKSSAPSTNSRDNEQPERLRLPTSYLRRDTTGIVFLDYCVKIGQDTYEWSPVVDRAGDEEHLNEASRDQWILKRQGHRWGVVEAAELPPPNTQEAIDRVNNDVRNCKLRCMTEDPARILPALLLAWQQGGSKVHNRTESSRWVNDFVTLSENDLQTVRRYHNSHATLGQRLLRPGSRLGPQIDLDGAPYASDREEARQKRWEDWDHAVSQMRNAVHSEEIIYYFDRTAPRDCSCTNTTKHFSAWTSAEAAAMGKIGPHRATTEEDRVVWGSLRIPITETSYLVLNGVRYCKSYTDNILSVAHVIAASNWVPTSEGLVDPKGNIFPLGVVTDRLDLCIDYDDRQLPLLQRLQVETDIPLVPMRLRAGSTLPAHVDMDMSGTLVTISMLPTTMLRAIALANIAASDVVDFLNNEVATHGHNWIKLPGWLEQPAHPSTTANDASAIIAATRTDPLPLIGNRSFDLESPPLRPSTSMVEARRARSPDDESVRQRARMTDTVAAVWNNWPGEILEAPRPTTIQVTITHAAIQGAESETVPAFLPVTSLHSYVNQRWLDEHAIVMDTSHPVRRPTCKTDRPCATATTWIRTRSS